MPVVVTCHDTCVQYTIRPSSVHSFIGLFTLPPWGYTNKLFRSEVLFRYKELEIGLWEAGNAPLRRTRLLLRKCGEAVRAWILSDGRVDSRSPGSFANSRSAAPKRAHGMHMLRCAEANG